MRQPTYRLEQRQVIPRPRAEVFAFFCAAQNLEMLTPDFLHFQILPPLPIAVHAGTHIDYQLQLFGVSFAWRTRIETFVPPERFIDIQLLGPYRFWHHLHVFQDVPEGTEMLDQVTYALPCGPLGRLAHSLFVRRTLKRIFTYRRHRLEALFPLPGSHPLPES